MPREVWSSYLHSLYGRRKGDVLEHDNKFLNSMGPHAKNKELCLRRFSKPLTNHAYTWYATLEPNSIATWDNMLESLCSKIFLFQWKREINIITHNTKQKPSKRLLDCIHRFKDTALCFYSNMRGTNLHQWHAKSLSCILGKSWYPFDLLHCSRRPTRRLHQ